MVASAAAADGLGEDGYGVRTGLRGSGAGKCREEGDRGEARYTLPRSCAFNAERERSMLDTRSEEEEVVEVEESP